MSEVVENMVRDPIDSVSVIHTPVQLDLYNFEEPQFEGSKFVLTSPRSLEACSQLGIKPVDLLYKSLTEFQEELLPQDVPLRTIYNIYDEQEQTRLRKLHLCREERSRLIEKETSKQHGFTDTTAIKNKPSIIISKALLESDMDKGSLQRRRTAWATSVGHQRLTNDEINQRAKELHEESLKLKRELLSHKEGKVKKGFEKKTPRETRSPSFFVAGKSCPTSYRNSTSAPNIKTKLSGQEKRKTVCSPIRMLQTSSKGDRRPVTSRTRTSELDKKGPVKSRTKTLLSSTVEQRGPLLSRTKTLLTSSNQEQKRPFSSQTRTVVTASDERGRPISSQSQAAGVARPSSAPSVGSKSSLGKPNIQIPSRDMKIIQLMKERRLEEVVSNKISRNAHLAWDEERRKEQQLKDQAEMRRRQLLAEENKNWNRTKENSELERRLLEEELLKEKEHAIKNKSEKWECSFSKQHLMKENKLADKIEKDKLRKCIQCFQERNLQHVQQDEQTMSTCVYEKILQDLRSAAMKKDVRLQTESWKKQQANKQEREQFERRKKFCDHLVSNKEDLLRMSLDAKHNKAASKFENVLNSRLHSLSLMHQQREKRLQKARLAQKRMDHQMATWREGLLEQRRKAEEHAEETAIRTIEMKSERAHRERVEREKEHKANIKKVQHDLKLWHKNLEKSVNAKLKKADVLQEEKTVAIMQTRAIAQESQRLRDEVRNHYNTDTFDKKVLEADCYARMGSGIYSSVKNTSTIKLAG